MTLSLLLIVLFVGVPMPTFAQTFPQSEEKLAADTALFVSCMAYSARNNFDHDKSRLRCACTANELFHNPNIRKIFHGEHSSKFPLMLHILSENWGAAHPILEQPDSLDSVYKLTEHSMVIASSICMKRLRAR